MTGQNLGYIIFTTVIWRILEKVLFAVLLTAIVLLSACSFEVEENTGIDWINKNFGHLIVQQTDGYSVANVAELNLSASNYTKIDDIVHCSALYSVPLIKT